MKLNELQSVCQQLLEQVDSTPETIINYLQLQPGFPGREDNSSSFISETHVEPHEGKVFGFTPSSRN